MRDKFWLFMIAFGGLSFFAPGLADPYMIPKIPFIALACLPLLLDKRESESRLEPHVLAFLLVAAVCCLVSQDRYYSLVGTLSIPGDCMMGYLLYAVVILAGARANCDIDDAARAVAWAGLPMCVYGLVQRVILNGDPFLPAPMTVRIVASQGGPVYLGAALAFYIVTSGYLAKQKERLGYVGMALALPALWFTQTRGAMLGAMAGLVFLWPKVALLGLPGLIMVPRFIAGVADLNRLELYRIALKGIQEFPIYGYGPGTFLLVFRRFVTWKYVVMSQSDYASQAHAHNDILQILATMGIFGLVGYLFLGLGLVIICLMWRRGNNRPWRLLAGLLACYFVISKFNPMPHGPLVVFFMLFGVASSVKCPEDRRYIPGLVAVLIVAVSARMCAAQWYYGKACRLARHDSFFSSEKFNRAAELNPWNVELVGKQVDSVIQLIGNAQGVESRRALCKWVHDTAEESLRKHPMDSHAHELYGKATIVAMLGGYGKGPHYALSEFRTASDLAPTFGPVMRRRLILARALQDKAEYLAAAISLNRLLHIGMVF